MRTRPIAALDPQTVFHAAAERAVKSHMRLALIQFRMKRSGEVFQTCGLGPQSFAHRVLTLTSRVGTINSVLSSSSLVPPGTSGGFVQCAKCAVLSGDGFVMVTFVRSVAPSSVHTRRSWRPVVGSTTDAVTERPSASHAHGSAHVKPCSCPGSVYSMPPIHSHQPKALLAPPGRATSFCHSTLWFVGL